MPTILARPEVGRRMIDKDKTSGRTPCVSESKNGHLFARSGREPYTGCARRDLYSSWRLARKQSALRRGSDIRIRVSRTSFRFRTRASFWGRRLGAYAMRHVFVAVLSAGSICAFACACHPAAAADTPFYATVTVTPVVGAPPWAPRDRGGACGRRPALGSGELSPSPWSALRPGLLRRSSPRAWSAPRRGFRRAHSGRLPSNGLQGRTRLPVP